MATERFVTPARYIAGKTNNAVLTVWATDVVTNKRKRTTIKGVGSYRLREDGSRFSVRASDGAGVRNSFVIEYGPGNSTGAVIKSESGRIMVKDVTLTLNEGTYPVIVA